MMNYANLEQNDKKKNICIPIIIIVIVISLIVGTSLFSYDYNNENKSFRRKINIIENDISNLYNYTETMSEFIVDKYKPIENIKDNEEISLKIQMDLKEEFNDFKNKSLKVQMDLKEELNDFKNKSLKVQMDLKKIMIRKIAIEFLDKTFNFNQYKMLFFNVEKNSCFYEKINGINLNDYYEQLLKIDYDNFIVSFAYFDDNEKINYMSHPFYKIINETLDYNYELLSKIPLGYCENCYYINNEYLNSFYYAPNFEGKYPYKELCNIPTVEYVYSRGINMNCLIKIYDEYEYIMKVIGGYMYSISPQKFL